MNGNNRGYSTTVVYLYHAAWNRIPGGVVDNKIRVSVLPIKSPQHESSELTSYPEVDGVGNEGKQRGRLFKSSGCNSETTSSPLVRREGEIRNTNGVASLHSL
jgi:hypothetical protein